MASATPIWSTRRSVLEPALLPGCNACGGQFVLNGRPGESACFRIHGLLESKKIILGIAAGIGFVLHVKKTAGTEIDPVKFPIKPDNGAAVTGRFASIITAGSFQLWG